MNNVKNRTKSILFVSLIAVMILSFSGMNNVFAYHTSTTST